MEKRKYRFLTLFCIFLLFVFVLLLSCYYKNSTKCFATIQKEVLIMSEFGLIRDSNNNDIGIGIVSFKVGDVLYAIGHHFEIEDISDASVYRVSPIFYPSTKEHLGMIYYNGKAEKLFGDIIQNSGNGLVISTAEFDTQMYSSITIADRIFSGDAQLLMRDEIGELQNYSISVRIIKFQEEILEISITDESLLLKTGGVIPGMSGCPIIQNGKLIGVVTHTVKDKPWKGYGKIIWNVYCIKDYTENN